MAEEKSLEIDETKPAGIKKRMQNLVQYSNKPRKITEEVVLSNIPEAIEQVKAELIHENSGVPVLSELSKTIPITVKAVLNKEELKIFLTEVEQWVDSHPDWSAKEDIEDIHGIAMEKVIQFRLLLKRKRTPRANIEKDYNSSVYRMQTFRQNLAARRAELPLPTPRW